MAHQAESDTPHPPLLIPLGRSSRAPGTLPPPRGGQRDATMVRTRTAARASYFRAAVPSAARPQLKADGSEGRARGMIVARARGRVRMHHHGLNFGTSTGKDDLLDVGVGVGVATSSSPTPTPVSTLRGEGPEPRVRVWLGWASEAVQRATRRRTRRARAAAESRGKPARATETICGRLAAVAGPSARAPGRGRPRGVEEGRAWERSSMTSRATAAPRHRPGTREPRHSRPLALASRQPVSSCRRARSDPQASAALSPRYIPRCPFVCRIGQLLCRVPRAVLANLQSPATRTSEHVAITPPPPHSANHAPLHPDIPALHLRCADEPNPRARHETRPRAPRPYLPIGHLDASPRPRSSLRFASSPGASLPLRRPKHRARHSIA